MIVIPFSIFPMIQQMLLTQSYVCPGTAGRTAGFIAFIVDQRPKQTYKRLSRHAKPAHRRLGFFLALFVVFSGSIS